MPPRSATRKKLTPESGKKMRSKAKLNHLEAELNDLEKKETETELENQGHELAAMEDTSNQPEGESVVAREEHGEEEIKSEVLVSDPNSTGVELSMDGDVERFAVSEEVEAKVESKAKVTEKCDNVAGDEAMAVEQSDCGHVDNDVTEMVAEQNLCKQGTAATEICDAEEPGLDDSVLYINDGGVGNEADEGAENNDKDVGDGEQDNKVDNINNNEEHPSVFINSHIADRKREKDLEIFISRLNKEAVENDLIKVFGVFGAIRAARVVRSRITNKSRGFAFIQYATAEQARNALSALKDGTKVRGKRVNVSACQDNSTLYVGNICNLWTKKHVLEALKSYGLGNVDEVHLPDDPQGEGKTKGFALLEFSTHSDAIAAFHRLKRPDAVFGCDRSARVAFAQSPPSEEVLSQVKTVCMEGLTDAWDKEKVKEMCGQYGEVVQVSFSQRRGSKNKCLGFVTFTSRESALACVEGINNADIGKGELKVKASIAKPQSKGRLQKLGLRGGFKVDKKIEVPSTKEESKKESSVVSVNMKSHARSKRAKKKRKTVAVGKGKTLSEPQTSKVGNPKKSSPEGECAQVSSKSERTSNKRKNQLLKIEGHRKMGGEHGHNRKPSKKKPQGDMQGKKGGNSRKTTRNSHVKKGPKRSADAIAYSNPHTPGYSAPAISYHSSAYPSISGSKRPYADMEPHAGYLEPVARKQGRSYSGFIQSPVGMQCQPHAGYLPSVVGTRDQPHAAYFEPALGTHGQPHAGYFEPAIALRRAGGLDLRSSGPSSYRPGPSLRPAYVPNYTHAGYQDGSSASAHYKLSRAHLPRRSYY